MSRTINYETASASAECSRDKRPFSFVRGQDSTMSDTIWVSPQGHRSVSVSRHFFLQALQCPCSVQKRFSRDHCCRGRSQPMWQIHGVLVTAESEQTDRQTPTCLLYHSCKLMVFVKVRGRILSTNAVLNPMRHTALNVTSARYSVRT